MERTYYKPKEETSFLAEHLVAIMIFVAIPIIILGCATIYWLQEPQLNEYRNGILNGVHDQKAKCDWLNLVVKVDGNGLWSLDPLENKIHQLAQDRLDRGDCLK